MSAGMEAVAKTARPECGVSRMAKRGDVGAPGGGCILDAVGCFGAAMLAFSALRVLCDKCTQRENYPRVGFYNSGQRALTMTSRNPGDNDGDQRTIGRRSNTYVPDTQSGSKGSQEACHGGED